MMRQMQPQVNSLREFIFGPWSFRRPGKDADTRAVDYLQGLAADAARGDEPSAKVLLEIAEATARWVSEAATLQPDLFQAMAMDAITWPVIWSNIPVLRRHVEADLKALQLGAGSKNASKLRLPFHDSRSSYIATKVAAYMGEVWGGGQAHPARWWMRAVRALPPLDQSTAPDWWPLAAEEIKRSFPKLHLWLVGASTPAHRRIPSEALRRVRTSFLNLCGLDNITTTPPPAPQEAGGPDPIDLPGLSATAR